MPDANLKPFQAFEHTFGNLEKFGKSRKHYPKLRTFSKPLEISNTLLETSKTFENFRNLST